MKYNEVSNANIIRQLAVWFGLILAFGVVFGIVVIILQLCGISTGHIAFTRLLLLYQDIFLFIVPVYLTARHYHPQPLEWLHLDRASAKANNATIWIAAALLMLVAIPAINLLSYWNQQIHLPAALHDWEVWMQDKETAAQAVVEQLLGLPGWTNLIVNIFIIAILAGLSEEICFRGMLQNLFPRQSPTVGIWVTAVIFSAIHLQFYGFIPRMLMGALFGYMLVWTGSLWVPVLMHCVNNATVTVVYYLCLRNGWDTAIPDTMGTSDTWWIGMISMIVVGCGIYCLRRSTTISNASSRTSIGN